MFAYLRPKKGVHMINGSPCIKKYYLKTIHIYLVSSIAATRCHNFHQNVLYSFNGFFISLLDTINDGIKILR